MYRGEIHEEHGHALHPIGVEGGYGGRLGAESSGGHNRHRMADGVEEGHAGEAVGHDGQHEQRQVDVGEDVDHVRGPGGVAAAAQRAQLHVGEAHAHLAGLGYQQQQEHHHSEAADEMRGGAPEKQAVGQGLHVGEYGGAAGRVAADRFEDGVRQRERAAPEHVGQQSEDEGQQPRERDDHVALAQRDRGRLAHEYEREDSDDEGDGERDHKGRESRVVAACHRHEDGQQHEQGVDEQREAYVPYDYLPVHLFLSSRTRRRSCWFSPASSEMPSLSSTSWSSPSNFTVYFLSLDL